MLLNFQTEDEFLLTLILLGQPPLLQTVSELQPLKERIAVKFNLEPLDFQNTVRYLLFRLKSAGAARGIFSRQAAGFSRDKPFGGRFAGRMNRGAG